MTGIRPLTARQKTILIMVANGYSNPQIMAELYIEDSSIESHMSDVRRNLKARNRAHAVAIALRRGEISLDDIKPVYVPPDRLKSPQRAPRTRPGAQKNSNPSRRGRRE